MIDIADFNDEKLHKRKEMIERLTNFVAIFECPGLDFNNLISYDAKLAHRGNMINMSRKNRKSNGK